MAKEQKVPINERALYQRINRKLKHEDEVLKKCRCGACTGRSQHICNIGPYYTLSLSTNSIQAHQIDDLEELAKEVGAIQPWEKLEA